MKYAISVPDNRVSITFEDGETVTVSTDSLRAETQGLVMLYGLKQKLSDAAASALKLSAETGRDIETQRKVMVKEMWDRLVAGTAFDRVSDGMGAVSYLARAVAELYSLTIEAAVEKLAEMDEEKKKALAAAPKVAALVAAMKAKAAAEKAERAGEKATGDEELPEL